MEGIIARWRCRRFVVSILIFGIALVQAGHVRPAIAQPAAVPNANPAAGATPDAAGNVVAQGEGQPSPPSSEGLSSLVADSPNMFGDFFTARGVVSVSVSNSFPVTTTTSIFSLGSLSQGNTGTIGSRSYSASSSLPLGGGCGRLDLEENNNALTQDRVYFLFNQFGNGLTANVSPTFGSPENYAVSPDRFSLGFEKRLMDGLWSIEMRLAGASQFSFDSAAGVGVSGGQFGDLGIIVKKMLYQSKTLALSAGLGLDIPTGSNTNGVFSGNSFTVNNEAVHLVPFVAILWCAEPRFLLSRILCNWTCPPIETQSTLRSAN